MLRNLFLIMVCAVVLSGCELGSPTTVVTAKEKSIHEFTMTDIDGKEVKLDSYKGKTALIVNTASGCGYTPQYEGLQKIYDKYKDQNFVVLGFPANNFMGQEPGTEAEIKEFCSTKYKVTFPMFAKISVLGKDQAPLYRFLTTSNEKFKGDVKWNFGKFLVNEKGEIVARFESKDTPESEKVIAAIEAELKN